MRGRAVAATKFRRQHALGTYIADFYSPQAKLIIELDGSSHNDRVEEDRDRDQILTALGLTVLRFKNKEVTNPLPAVVARMAATLTRPSSSPGAERTIAKLAESPRRQGGEVLPPE